MASTTTPPQDMLQLAKALGMPSSPFQPPWHVHWASHIKWIVVVGIACATAWFGWSKWVSHRDQADHDQAVIAHEKVQADFVNAAQAQQQVASLQTQLAQQNQQLSLLRQEVSNAIASRNAATVARKEQESTASLNDVASRWATLIGASDTDIRVETGGNIAVTPSTGRKTTQALEDGATAEANLTDTLRVDAGKDSQIEGLNSLVKSMDVSAKSQATLLQDQVAGCKAEAKAAEDEAAKKARHSFWHGIVLGAGAAGAIALRFL